MRYGRYSAEKKEWMVVRSQDLQIKNLTITVGGMTDVKGLIVPLVDSDKKEL